MQVKAWELWVVVGFNGEVKRYIAYGHYVNGEVKMPGSFVYEKGLTVHKAITLAGGFTDKAAKTSTKVLRMINGKEQTIEISLDAQVLAEDIIVVPQRFF